MNIQSERKTHEIHVGMRKEMSISGVRDVESFDGLTVNGYIAANGNGFSEEQQEYIRTHVKGKFEAEF